MRTPEEIYDEWLKGDVADSTVDFFREVQKEAWNEATKQAVESAEILMDHERRIAHLDKDSILKNLK